MANGTLLDYENAPSHAITVRVTDQGWPVKRRPSFLGALTFACGLLFATVAGAQIARDDPRLNANQIHFEYGIAHKPEHETILVALKSARLLETLQELLSPLRLPFPITLKMEDCDGAIQAYFDHSTVKVCYEYLACVMKYVPKMEKQGLSVRDAILGPAIDVFLHEFGHGLVRVLEVPFFGKEEDVADYIGTYLLLEFCKDDARRLILGALFIGDAEALEAQGKAPELRALADTHSLPAQRYFNRWCMAYGADPKLFSDAIEIGMLPEARVKWCKYEWQSNRFAFQQLVEPFIDKPMKDKIVGRGWFKFESPVPDSMNAPKAVLERIQSGLPSQPPASMK